MMTPCLLLLLLLLLSPLPPPPCAPAMHLQRACVETRAFAASTLA